MSHTYGLARAYQDQLLHDAEFDRIRDEAAPQKRKRALEFIRPVLRVWKPASVLSQSRLEAADLDANPV
jgi:hypothetical protein